MITIELDKSVPSTKKYSNTPVIDDDDSEMGESDETLLLRINQRFGHIYFPRLLDITRPGLRPGRLMKCKIPYDQLAYMLKQPKIHEGKNFQIT